MGKKKRKNRRIRPPLTLFDKSIYIVCFLAAILGLFFFGGYLEDLTDRIAFGKTDAIAYAVHTSHMLILPFLIFFVISAFCFFLAGFAGEKPIFGSKKYNYGEYPYEKDCVPLFYRRDLNPKEQTRKRRFARRTALLWLLWFLLCFLTASPIPLGLFGRDVLYQDNRIEDINLFNKVSDTYTTEDFSYLTIEAEHVLIRSRYGGSNYWIYEISIEMTDGKEYSFSNRAFEGGPLEEADACLNKMLEIKALFESESIRIIGAEKTDKTADYLKFNERQKDKLNELFSK